ncbi:MAG: TSUP family transporter [Pseudomonadota bacterium]
MDAVECFGTILAMAYLIIAFATLLTSIISGVLSMAGGVILMGVLGLLLPVPAAMVLHGVAQTASNGSRIVFHRRHIRWPVLIPYLIGALAALALFTLFIFVPDKALIFIVIGLFPFLSLAIPDRLNLDIERPIVATICGFSVTVTQLLAGASGPVLDVFYVKSRLTRHQVLATKAVTQTSSHVIKLGYYLTVIGLTVDLPIWVYVLVIAAAIAGNAVGKSIVAKIDDVQFRYAGRIIILIMGTLFLGNGIRLLVL